jgi:hypothetical protein
MWLQYCAAPCNRFRLQSPADQPFRTIFRHRQPVTPLWLPFLATVTPFSPEETFQLRESRFRIKTPPGANKPGKVRGVRVHAAKKGPRVSARQSSSTFVPATAQDQGFVSPKTNTVSPLCDGAVWVH